MLQVIFPPLIEADNPSHVGRNVHLIEWNNNNANKEEEQESDDDDNNNNNHSLILCHVPLMFRWTTTSSTSSTSKPVDVSNWAYGGSAAAILGLYHFNTGNGISAHLTAFS